MRWVVEESQINWLLRKYSESPLASLNPIASSKFPALEEYYVSFSREFPPLRMPAIGTAEAETILKTLRSGSLRGGPMFKAQEL